jgi:hypothetical protein
MGDLCPKCKEGHLYPTGARFFKEGNRGREQEYDLLKCDKCGNEEHVLGLTERITASVKVTVQDHPYCKCGRALQLRDNVGEVCPECGKHEESCQCTPVGEAAPAGVR